nr:MAG TPA: hypothetical protein [Caudoviricetes sp.]
MSLFLVSLLPSFLLLRLRFILNHLYKGCYFINTLNYISFINFNETFLAQCVICKFSHTELLI